MGHLSQLSDEQRDSQVIALLSEADILAVTTIQNGNIEIVDKRIELYKQALQIIAIKSSSIFRRPQGEEDFLDGLELTKGLCVFHISSLGISYKVRPLLHQIGMDNSVSKDGIMLDIDVESSVVAEPLLLSCLLGLSDSYNDRQDFADRTEDVECELAYATFCLDLASPGSMQQAEALSSIGRSLKSNMERFRLTNQHLSIGHIATIFRRALETSTKCGDSTILYVCALTGTLLDISYATGSDATMKEPIGLLRQSLLTTPETHPHRYRLLRILAGAFHNRFLIKGIRSDFQECLSLYQECMQLCPVGHREHIHSLANIGGVYLTECRLNPSKDGSLDPLNLAIRYLQMAYDQRPFPRRLIRDAVAMSICNGLYLRFHRLGDVKDLQDAMTYAREGLLSAPHSPELLNSLAGVCCTRYETLGEIKDLEESVKCIRQALAIWREGHPYHTHALSNLGKLLLLRFRRMLQEEDLAEAIILLRKALALSQPPNPFWAPILFNLSSALKERYLHEENLENLNEALDMHILWLKHHTSFDLMTGEHAYLDMIAELLRLRFERLGNIADLEQALTIHEQAEHVRPVGHSTEHRSISSLAQTIFLRGEFAHSIDDIHRALAIQSKVVQTIPSDHVDRSIMLFCLARFYLAKTLPWQNATNSLDCYSKAINDIYCPASTRLVEGLHALHALEDHFRREDCQWTQEEKLSLLDNYRATVRLLPQVAFFGLDVRTRLRLLSRAPSLAVDASIHATRMHSGAIAIEVLEEARAVFWTQYLRLRSSFDELPQTLREQLEDISRRLQASTIQAGDPPTKVTYEDQQAERRCLSDQFENLVFQARRLPGFDQFLLSDRFEALSIAAQSSPVLILLANSTFCGALLIRRASSNVEQLTLNLKPDSLIHANGMIRGSTRSTRAFIIKHKPRLSSRTSKNSEDALSLLWNEVMQKVVSTMGWKKQRGHERPRLVICATGAFSDIPVHAAGTITETCTDYFVPSYTPTLGALIAAHKSFKPIRCRDAKVLLAIAPRPFKWSPLPGAVTEAAIVRKVLSTVQATSVPQLTGMKDVNGSSATCNDLLLRIPHANIFHLACHGHTNPSNVLESGFILADRMLMLTELMELNLPNAFFAFLSACESARGSKEQGDQAVHLAATMMFAGFKSVIGTMWSMNDIDGPSVAQKVYEEFFSQESEYLSPDSIPYALDSAVRELRGKGLHPSRWACYVHYGI